MYSFLMKYIDNKYKSLDSLYLYTYWWLDESIAIALLKEKSTQRLKLFRGVMVMMFILKDLRADIYLINTLH